LLSNHLQMVDTVATIHDMDVSVSEDSITKEASCLI
jgi:hypothetical protein